MKAKPLFCLSMSAICLLSSGCALSDNFLRTTVIQPVQFCNYWDAKRQHHHFQKLAELELERAQSTARAELDNYACEPFSVDKKRGFEEGFVDYLLHGGTGHPPPLPPRRYWRLEHQNSDGYRAMQDWFEGYQHGAAVAQASEYRKFTTVLTSDALMTDTLPFYPGQLSDVEPAESGDTVPDDDERPAGLLARAPHLPDSPPLSEPGSPPVEARFPAAPESWPQLGPSPVFELRDSSGTDRSMDIDIESPLDDQDTTGDDPVWSPASRGADGAASSGGESLPKFAIQPVTAIQLATAAAPPADLSAASFWSVERSAASELVLHPDQPSLSSTLPTRTVDVPVASESRDLSDGELHSIFRTQLARMVTPWAASLGAAAQGVFTLLLLGGIIIFFVRRRPRSINTANRRQRQPDNPASRSDGLAPNSPAPVVRGQEMGTKDRVATQTYVAMFMVLVLCMMTGCASLTNPVLNGIPVRRLPTELLSSPHREGLQTVPLSLLRQQQVEDYVLAAGDVVGVFIAGVFPLTLVDQALPTPPVYFPSQIDPLGAGLPPSMGYPVTIRNDGALAMPLVGPIMLEGLTVEEANQRVRSAYVEKGILQPGREAVLVTLMQPRQVRVLVFRQEVGGFSSGGRGDISGNNIKQGTGHIVDLRAYENDVLTALANTGGLPGLDAFDGIFIFRGGQSNAALTQTLQSLQPCGDLSQLADLGVETDYIPTRWAPGEPLPFKPEDVLLHEGDVVLLEARVQDLYYTGGLLPVGERVLPRDYDLDVVEAVAKVSGTLLNGAFGGNNFTGLLIQRGIGNPNPSALTVIRRTPNGGQIPISVDLNRALIDPRERILVQPNDVLILQETGNEAVARYFKDVFNYNIFLQAFQRGSASGSAALSQLP